LRSQETLDGFYYLVSSSQSYLCHREADVQVLTTQIHELREEDNLQSPEMTAQRGHELFSGKTT